MININEDRKEEESNISDQNGINSENKKENFKSPIVKLDSSKKLSLVKEEIILTCSLKKQ